MNERSPSLSTVSCVIHKTTLGSARSKCAVADAVAVADVVVRPVQSVVTASTGRTVDLHALVDCLVAGELGAVVVGYTANPGGAADTPRVDITDVERGAEPAVVAGRAHGHGRVHTAVRIAPDHTHARRACVGRALVAVVALAVLGADRVARTVPLHFAPHDHGREDYVAQGERDGSTKDNLLFHDSLLRRARKG